MKKCILIHPEDAYDIAFEGKTTLDMSYECPALGERIYIYASNDEVDDESLFLQGYCYISAVCVECISSEIAHYEWHIEDVHYIEPIPYSGDEKEELFKENITEHILFNETEDTSDIALLEDIPEFMKWYEYYENALKKNM